MSPRATVTSSRALRSVAVDVLQSLHQHRVLTASQVHVLHTPGASLRWTQRILTQLHRRGFSDRAAGPRGIGLWFLTPRGAGAVQAAGHLADPRRHATTAAQAAGALRAHTLAVNDTGIAFVKAARECPGDDCGPLAWRHEIAHRYTNGHAKNGAHLVIADALLSYLQAGGGDSLILHQRFIELDRGTIPAEHLAGKLARYSQLLHHSPGKPTGQPLWRNCYRSFPPVLVVLADQMAAAARRRIQKTIALYRSDPVRARYGTVPVSFTTLADLQRRGPFAPIFIAADHPGQPTGWLGEPTPQP
jgi:Replication-relaxation